MDVGGFRELRVWQGAMELVTEVYRLTGGFPRSEVYGLATQLRRAVVSVPSNIAEGQARYHLAEYLQFLATAHASLAEVDTQLEIASRLGYVEEPAYLAARERIERLGRQLRVMRGRLGEKRGQHHRARHRR